MTFTPVWGRNIVAEIEVGRTQVLIRMAEEQQGLVLDLKGLRGRESQDDSPDFTWHC